MRVREVESAQRVTSFGWGLRRTVPKVCLAGLGILAGCGGAIPSNPNVTVVPGGNRVVQTDCSPLIANISYACPDGRVDVSPEKGGSLLITVNTPYRASGNASITMPYSNSKQTGGVGTKDYCSIFVEVEKGTIDRIYESCEYPSNNTPTSNR